MSLEKATRFLTGLVVMVGVAIGHFYHPYGYYLSAFIGFMLFQSAFTGTCPGMMVLKAIGFKPSAR